MSRTSHSSQGPSYASHRSNASISSTASSSTRSERGGSRYPAATPAVETAVTRLLVSIKQLLEALTLWSQRRMDEEGVSDVYVRLGNDFNAAVNAFTQFDIDMSELLSVPDDLRTVLEQCLAEEATHDNLDLYLPSVRQIITNLLQGLRGKQSIYRRRVSDNRDKPKDQDRESQSGSSRPPSHRTSSSRSDRPESRRTHTGPSRRREDISNASNRTEDGRDSDSSYPTTITEHTTGQSEARAPSIHSNGRSTPQPTLPATDVAESSYDTPTAAPEPPPSVILPTPDVEEIAKPSSPPPVPTMTVPASVKRYSLVDGPAPPPTVEPPSPPVEVNGTASPPPPDTPPPAVAKSLEALKSENALERRASKRFSTYLYKNVTGSAKAERTKASSNPNRRSVAPGMSLTSNELDMVAEETDNEEPGPSVKRSLSARSKTSRANTPVRQHIPPVPSTPLRTPEPGQVPSTPVRAETPPPSEPSRYTLFLQLGREVKKVTVDPGISFPSLRMLFLDKFAYNPGLENFPAIYIRDPSSGVQYELEDTDEVKDKCLLSLNIEPLDQIKQHIDTQILTLANDIKDLKTTVMQHRDSPPPMPMMMMNSMSSEPMAESTPARPTDKQFQQSARRLSTFVGNSTPSFLSQMQSTPLPAGHLSMQMTGQSLQPQMTGGSVLSDYTSRVVTDLKTQFDEVQNLRRDIGVMRQMYTEFMKSTKESLGKMRSQTQSVKQLADTNVGGARAYIDSGKQKLDTRSQNVLTEVERLQDLIEDMKDDVVKRQVTPNGMAFKNLKKDLDAVASELDSLTEHIATVRPMWKKTWEEELQNIVDEQKLLTHQEELLSDLKDDHKAMMEIYGHVEKVITLRKPANNSFGKRRQFRPPPKEEGHEGLTTVMLEIRGATVDPRKRMEAIEASQKNRQKNLNSKNDELTQELGEFVSQKKLKMTGGAEEVERVRQKRSEMTMRAMFAGESGIPAGPFGVIDP